MNFDQLIKRLGLSHMPNRGPAARFGNPLPAQQMTPPPGAVPMGPHPSGRVGASLPMAKTLDGMFRQARQVGAMNRAMGISPQRSVSQRVR